MKLLKGWISIIYGTYMLFPIISYQCTPNIFCFISALALSYYCRKILKIRWTLKKKKNLWRSLPCIYILWLSWSNRNLGEVITMSQPSNVMAQQQEKVQYLLDDCSSLNFDYYNCELGLSEWEIWSFLQVQTNFFLF